jgi:hypothetical protein
MRMCRIWWWTTLRSPRITETFGGVPPSPQVSLSGSNSFGLFGLRALLAFNRMITKGLRPICRKTKDLSFGKCGGPQVRELRP